MSYEEEGGCLYELHRQYASYTGPIPLEVRVHACGVGAGPAAARCGSLGDTAGSCGAVQRYNDSDGKPSKKGSWGQMSSA